MSNAQADMDPSLHEHYSHIGVFVEGCHPCEEVRARRALLDVRPGVDKPSNDLDGSVDASPSPYDEDGRFILYSENPLRHTYETGGIKDNRGKAPVDLLPSAPLMAIAQILAFGATKYKPHNWRYGLPWRDTYASMMRHLLAWNDGETNDPETGESHLAHAGCQLLFLLEFTIKGIGADDRHSAIVATENAAPKDPS